MKIKLPSLLKKLGDFRDAPPPELAEVSMRSGVALETLERIQRNPRVSIQTEELNALVQYLFREFRPHLDSNVTDQQLFNQLCYELYQFQFNDPDAGGGGEKRQGGYSLRDLSLE